MARKIGTAALLGAAMIFSAELAGAHAPSPVAGTRLYVDPASNALLQARQWQGSRPREAEVMRRIGNQPVAHWFGEWSGDVRGAVNRLVSSAAASGSVPVLVAYNIPQRDCGSYSAGGAHSADGYRSWIRSFANGIGRRAAIVILEPDGLGIIPWYNPFGDRDGWVTNPNYEWCQPNNADPATAATDRFTMMNYAVHTLKAHPKV